MPVVDRPGHIRRHRRHGMRVLLWIEPVKIAPRARRAAGQVTTVAPHGFYRDIGVPE